MKIKITLLLIVLFSLLTPNLWAANSGDATPPQVSSSAPAHNSTDINMSTKCLIVTFNEDMNTSSTALAWNCYNQASERWGNPEFVRGQVYWRNNRTVEICRLNDVDLTPGTYTFYLNDEEALRRNQLSPFTDTSGNQLPETEISFIVSNTAPTNYTYYVPYFSSGNGYWTGLGISNNSNADTASVSITPYNTDGTPLSQNPDPPFPIVKNGQTAKVVADGLNATGWFKVESSCELSGLCFIGSTLMADIPFVSTLSDTLMIPHVAQGNKWDTKIMVCNPNNLQPSLTLTYYTKMGVATTVTPNQPLPAMGSAIYNLSSTFNGMTMDYGKIKITVTQGGNVAAFALYYNTNYNGSYFAGISADPITGSRGAATH